MVRARYSGLRPCVQPAPREHRATPVCWRRPCSLSPVRIRPAPLFPRRSLPDDAEQFDSDVFFAGGADTDRAACIGSLRRAGFRVALYGNYWTRFAATRPITRGQALA